jgi:hypothetical protein
MVDIKASSHKKQVTISFILFMLMSDAAAANDRPRCECNSFVAETDEPLHEHISATAAALGLNRSGMPWLRACVSVQPRAPVCTWPALCVVL